MTLSLSTALKTALTASTLLFTACSVEPITSDMPETMTLSDPESANMIAAGQAVQDTLPNFLKKIENPPEEWESFSVKVAFDTRDNSHEHIWVSDVVQQGDDYSGTVDNEPYNVEALSYGDEVTFKYADISDWQYEKNGRLHGNYTTRAMLKNMTPEQREQVLSLLSETPE